MKPTVVVVGDGIIDRILEPVREIVSPGGAALNLAVGVSILGDDATLVFNWADDPEGRVIAEHLARYRVRQVVLNGEFPTGIATARPRDGGSLRYSFNDAALVRTFSFTDHARGVAEEADVLAVTSFPFDDADSVEGILRLYRGSGAIKVVDPNPRPTLIRDLDAFRGGFERIAAVSDLVKVSDEDLHILYDTDEVPDCLGGGRQAVLVTHGSRGATAQFAGRKVHRPIVELPLPIVDTLGAGDATLASVIHSVGGSGMPGDAEAWLPVLERAMTVAAWTCRSSGGLLHAGEEEGAVL